MHPQTFFENPATLADSLEALARGLAAAIVPSQIGKRVLAFKDRCRSNLFLRRAIGSDVGTISASRQTHFHRARRVAMRLRPEKSEPF